MCSWFSHDIPSLGTDERKIQPQNPEPETNWTQFIWLPRKFFCLVDLLSASEGLREAERRLHASKCTNYSKVTGWRKRQTTQRQGKQNGHHRTWEGSKVGGSPINQPAGIPRCRHRGERGEFFWERGRAVKVTVLLNRTERRPLLFCFQFHWGAVLKDVIISHIIRAEVRAFHQHAGGFLSLKVTGIALQFMELMQAAGAGVVGEGKKVTQQFFASWGVMVHFVLQQGDVYSAAVLRSSRCTRIVGKWRDVGVLIIAKRKRPEIQRFPFFKMKFVNPQILLLSRGQFAFWACSLHIVKALAGALCLLVHVIEGLGEFQSAGGLYILSRPECLAPILPTGVSLCCM